MIKRLKNQKGIVLAIVIGFMALLLLSALSLSTMIQTDITLIRRVKEKEQARYMAEAGINHALAIIKRDGFAARADFNDLMDTGGYVVTFSEVGGRHLVTSVGTVSGVSVTASAEIEDRSATALNYFSGAGNDIKINALVANAVITGDIHANNNVYLKSGPIIAWLSITGDVSASGIVKLGSRYHQSDLLDKRVVINALDDENSTVYEGEDRITFPVFNYEAYKEAAIASGDYYDSDTLFDGVTISPANGIVYVDGDATLKRGCVLNGGVIADNIHVIGTLEQYKTGDNRNVVMAKSGDIRIYGRLYAEEAVVYASQDIRSLQIFTDIEINGVMLAGRDIRMWNVLTTIQYNHVDMSPEDIEHEFRLVSWNT